MRNILIMEDGASTPNTIVSNLMDELLYVGFWLEATDGSNFMQPHSTTLSNLNSSSFYFPTSETNIGSVNTNPHQENFLKETANLDLFSEPALSCIEMDEFSASQSNNHEADVPSVSLNNTANFAAEEAQMNRRLWVAPNRNSSVKDRLVQAINCLKDSVKDKDVLIQIWIPVKRGGRQVLTTNNQPFSLNPNCKNLADYRDVSQNYQFAADEDSKEFVGLPGRVFLNELPEWTPDVRFFKREEYLRVKHALQYDVRGSLALPVFEQGSGVCLGVVEIVTTSQKVNYRPELENVCKVLEAVALKSSNIPSHSNIKDSNELHQDALAEIRNVLKFVCDTHKLPLAQTWASCVQQSKGGCRHSDKNFARCISTIDSACCVVDPQVSGFHEACSEHHLLKGEGVVGKAFLTNQLCFSKDITAFRKAEYPLAHHARVFNLCASAAIRLRSTYNRTDDFVLEFFLPLSCKDTEDQMLMLNSISSAAQQSCQNLRVIMDQELALETLDDERDPKVAPSKESSSDASNWIMSPVDPKGKGVAVSLANSKEEQEGEFKVATQWDNSEDSGNFSLTIGNLSLCANTNSERRRTKTEKTISLQVLRQYFAGSLKEAAKGIGVCPTTLKRICRQHGITRWPSRKIKKVDQSLRKLQLVIDSVQGAEHSIQLNSFYNNFPELVSPNAPGTSHFSTSKISGHLQQMNNQPVAITASKSPSSSGSLSFSSSYCCSAFKQHGDALSAEQTGGMIKKARSEAELHEKGQEEMKLLIRSFSHKILSDLAAIEAPSVPTNSNQAHDVGTFRVKCAFGNEKIRFNLQPQWGFKNLKQEIFRRFNIDNGSSIALKYLDDDAEWVLLTCDADLEECRDIHRSSKSRRIKLSVNQAHHPNLGTSFGI